MGNSSSTPAAEGSGLNATPRHTPDAELSSNITTAEENERKRQQYARLKSSAASSSSSSAGHTNVIENVYNEDFDSIDHIQAMRLPPYVSKQIKDAVRNECERRCAEKEKTMARCLQDKMWTSWKCQKERDAYYHCVEDEEKRNTTPRRAEHDDGLGAQAAAAAAAGSGGKSTTSTSAPDIVDDDFVDLLTAYRWKFNLGVLHGEIMGRNAVMRKIWGEHFPDRELPHPWVKEE